MIKTKMAGTKPSHHAMIELSVYTGLEPHELGGAQVDRL